MVRAWLRHLSYVLPLALVLAWLDWRLSDARTAGWERNAVRGALIRAAKKPDASGVVLLGSSTSRDWLPVNSLSWAFDVPREDVLDAHINGCHQGCTYAQVRRFLAEGRHFDVAIYGTNQFQLCEYPHSKRVLQHGMLLPTEDIPRILPRYVVADEPLTYFVRLFGGKLSGIYADTAAVRSKLADWVFGRRPRGRDHRWYRRHPPPRETLRYCRYESADVAYKRGLSEALLEELTSLADRVFVVLLPDSSLSSEDREVIEAWKHHRSMHRELTREHSTVELIDLTLEGASHPEQFRDGFHLTRWERLRQRRQFMRVLQARGHGRFGGDP